jgi:hypothetical protein
MRTLLIGTLAATLVGCSCLLPPQASREACTDANGFACYDRTAASQPIEPKPASFKSDSTTIEIKSTIAAKTEKPLSADARDRAHLAVKTANSTMIAAKVEPPASRIQLSPRSLKTRLQPASNAAADSDTTRSSIADSHPTGGAVANSNTRTIQHQLAAATAVAELMTFALWSRRQNRKRIITTVPITRKPCCVAMPKRAHLRRQTTRTFWLHS